MHLLIHSGNKLINVYDKLPPTPTAPHPWCAIRPFITVTFQMVYMQTFLNIVHITQELGMQLQICISVT